MSRGSIGHDKPVDLVGTAGGGAAGTRRAMLAPNDFEVREFQTQCCAKFGEYEGVRIGSFFIDNEYEYIEPEQARRGVQQLFDEDLDEIIA